MSWGARAPRHTPGGAPPEVGKPAVVISGRYRGSRGVVVSIEPVTSPTGHSVMVALVKLRDGDAYVFPTDLRIEEGA